MQRRSSGDWVSQQDALFKAPKHNLDVVYVDMGGDYESSQSLKH